MRLRKLSRAPALRAKMLRDLVAGLCLRSRLVTTEARAKAVKRIFDRKVTYARAGRRDLLGDLPREAREALHSYTKGLGDRQGGYLRSRLLGWRRGDGAPMAELTFLF